MRVKVKSQLGLLLHHLLPAVGNRNSRHILPVSIAQKATITPSLVIVSEVSFWLGILLTGKELAQRYRRKLSPYYWWQRITNSK